MGNKASKNDDSPVTRAVSWATGKPEVNSLLQILQRPKCFLGGVPITGLLTVLELLLLTCLCPMVRIRSRQKVTSANVSLNWYFSVRKKTSVVFLTTSSDIKDL